MNSIWNKNIRLFQTRFPELAKLFENHIAHFNSLAGSENEAALHPFWRVSTAKNGMPTAEEGDLRLHSAYNPLREAENFINARQDDCKNADAVLFTGFGLGYAVIEAAKRFPHKDFLIAESDPAHFFASLLLLDWKDVFSLPNIVTAVACTPEQLLTLINRREVRKTAVLTQKAYTEHDAAYFSVVQTLIERSRRKEEINAATLKRFGALWERNIRANMDTVRSLGGVEEYCGRYKGASFLLIAAGPSLQDILPHLPDLQKRLVTVCVDTALRACLSCGVEPDFIVLTDPQYWAYRHIAGLAAPSSVLITQASVVPAVFRFPCRKIVTAYSMLPVCREFENELKAKGDLGAGGSVASAAWNFAYLAGASEIYTAGLDLAYPANLTHIRGSAFEQSAHIESARLHPAETRGMPALFGGNIKTGKDYRGRPVRTDARMQMFAWWFESRIAACPDVKTYSLSDKALAIPGVELRTADALTPAEDK
ncbi:MAG: motility associated factor glycosyltransferase family protein [Treponema sp.]